MGRLRRHSVEDSAPLILPLAEPTTTSGLSKIFKWGLILAVSLLLAGGVLTGILMMTVFNVCPHQHSTPISMVTCSNTSSSPRHGTHCNLTCRDGNVPSGVLHDTCGWMGKWSHPPLTCTSPGLMVVGYTYEGRSTKSIAEIFPSSFLRDKEYQDPPLMLHGPVSGFFAGSPMVCGGLNLHTGKLTAKCNSLNKDNKWVTTVPLLKEIYLASGIITNKGRSFWILGGVDSTKNVQKSTMVLHDYSCGHNNWIQGPEMNTFRVLHCSANMKSSSIVMVTGGSNSKESLDEVEMYDWESGLWSTGPHLKEARQDHTCASVFINHKGYIETHPNQHSELTVIVAGGYKIQGNITTQLSSVGMLVGDKWKFLPPLPRLITGLRMSFPSGLIWRPGTGLQLVGGCHNNDTARTTVCSNLAWTLETITLAKTVKWVARIGETLDKFIMPGNTALIIPNNYLRSPKQTTSTTESLVMTLSTTQSNNGTTGLEKMSPTMDPNTMQIKDRSLVKSTETFTGQESLERTGVKHQTDFAYPILPETGTSFGPDITWKAPLKMAMFMRNFLMNFKAIDIDEDKIEDNNFGHFSQGDYSLQLNNSTIPRNNFTDGSDL